MMMIHINKLLALFDKLPEGLKNFFSIIVKISVDLIDSLFLNHPKLTFSLLDQPSIVANKNHTY